MLRRIASAVAAALILAGCHYPVDHSRLGALQIGMTREQVASTLGFSGVPVGHETVTAGSVMEHWDVYWLPTRAKFVPLTTSYRQPVAACVFRDGRLALVSR